MAKQKQKPKAPGTFDRLLSRILIPMLVLVVCQFARRELQSPWTEVLSGLQFICLAVIIFLIVRTFPHPIRSLNQGLARERTEVRREKRRKKSKRKRR